MKRREFLNVAAMGAAGIATAGVTAQGQVASGQDVRPKTRGVPGPELPDKRGTGVRVRRASEGRPGYQLSIQIPP